MYHSWVIITRRYKVVLPYLYFTAYTYGAKLNTSLHVWMLWNKWKNCITWIIHVNTNYRMCLHIWRICKYFMCATLFPLIHRCKAWCIYMYKLFCLHFDIYLCQDNLSWCWKEFNLWFVYEHLPILKHISVGKKKLYSVSCHFYNRKQMDFIDNVPGNCSSDDHGQWWCKCGILFWNQSGEDVYC